jgi:hypothetical protein
MHPREIPLLMERPLIAKSGAFFTAAVLADAFPDEGDLIVQRRGLGDRPDHPSRIRAHGKWSGDGLGFRQI